MAAHRWRRYVVAPWISRNAGLPRRLIGMPPNGTKRVVHSVQSNALAVWKDSTHEGIGSDLAFFGSRARWQNFGRSVNLHPRTGRGPDFVPAGNGTAHVFKTGCPSLCNRRTGELVILDEAGS